MLPTKIARLEEVPATKEVCMKTASIWIAMILNTTQKSLIQPTEILHKSCFAILLEQEPNSDCKILINDKFVMYQDCQRQRKKKVKKCFGHINTAKKLTSAYRKKRAPVTGKAETRQNYPDR